MQVKLNENFVFIYKKENHSLFFTELTSKHDVTYKVQSEYLINALLNIIQLEKVDTLSNHYQNDFAKLIQLLCEYKVLISTDHFMPPSSTTSTESTVITYPYFTFSIEETHTETLLVQAQVPNEGGACSTQGSVQCGHDNYLYECISDGTWAGLGTSC